MTPTTHRVGLDKSTSRIIDELMAEIREAREAAGRLSTVDELREIVEQAHDARRIIVEMYEDMYPAALDEVQSDLDYLYAELQRLDPNALDKLAARDAEREADLAAERDGEPHGKDAFHEWEQYV